jgi:hypothetical protein
MVGVDEFALRGGHVHGTVPIDILTGRPLDPAARPAGRHIRRLAACASWDRGDLSGRCVGIYK